MLSLGLEKAGAVVELRAGCSQQSMLSKVQVDKDQPMLTKVLVRNVGGLLSSESFHEINCL